MKEIIVTGKLLTPSQCNHSMHYRVHATSISCAEWSRPHVCINRQLCLTVDTMSLDVREVVKGDIIKITFAVMEKTKPTVVKIESCHKFSEMTDFVAKCNECAKKDDYSYGKEEYYNEEDEETE